MALPMSVQLLRMTMPMICDCGHELFDHHQDRPSPIAWPCLKCMCGFFYGVRFSKKHPKHCECEHKDHEVRCSSIASIAGMTTLVITVYGKFNVCQQCAVEHPIPQDMRRG